MVNYGIDNSLFLFYTSTTPLGGIVLADYICIKKNSLAKSKKKYRKDIIMQADKTKIMRLLKTARGQMDGIIKMIEEDRYCIDISQQMMAVSAILNTANKEILSAHLKNCINGAETKEERDAKVDELMTIISKISK